LIREIIESGVLQNKIAHTR